jgi:hypothetical protein
LRITNLAGAMLSPHLSRDALRYRSMTARLNFVSWLNEDKSSHQSELEDKGQNRNCRRRSNRRVQVSGAPGNGDNRKRKDKHSSAWFFWPDVHSAGK